MPTHTSDARTVFISYARGDEEIIQPVAHLLRAAGAVVFLDSEDIPCGENWESVLLAKLHASERILVFWSVNAANSEWVRREYLRAIGAGLRIAPVPLDSTPLPAELAAYQALTALVPLVHQAQRSLVSRGIWKVWYGGRAWYAALIAFILVDTLALFSVRSFPPLPSYSVPGEALSSGSEPISLLRTSSLLVVGILVVILFGALLKRAAPLTQWRGKNLQASIYDTVFSETNA